MRDYPHIIEHLDIIELFPVYGHKSKKKLRFSEINLNSTDSLEIGDLKLHGLDSDQQNMKIQLTNRGYEIKSDSFFECNGVLAKEVLLQDGDQIRFNENLVKFKKSSEIKKESKLDLLAKSNHPIHLFGETGTGKSYIAKRIHQLSGLKGKFTQLSLSTLNENLIESELFGHIKGAFTGAIRDKVGAITQSKGGTLFLDEIDSLSLNFQKKLLLFLDNMTFRPVGSEKEYSSNTRLIFASNRSLEVLVNENKFRSDLFYRIDKSLTWKLSPLREDREKILRICKQFEEQNFTSIDRSLIEFYKDLPWYGNIRQLIGHLEKKLIFQKKRLTFDETDRDLSVKS